MEHSFERKLSFLLLGVARSGTSAITAALNTHPALFCGMEALDLMAPHRGVTFPQSFAQRLPALSGPNHDALKTLLAEKTDTAEVIGNKEPHYDLVLRDLVQSTPGLKLVFIYRSPREFANSWNMRAADDNDALWHPGRKGLFGALSLLTYLFALRQVGADCLIVPYAQFSRDVFGTTAQILDYLGIPDSDDLARHPLIQYLQQKADALRIQPRQVRANEDAFLKGIGLEELDRLFDCREAFPYDDVRQQVNAYLNGLSGFWGEKFIESISLYNDPRVPFYFRKMLNRPFIREMFEGERKSSKRLNRYMRLIPRGTKLRRILFRGSDDMAPYARFIRKVNHMSAARV